MRITHPPHLEIGARTEPPLRDFHETQRALEALVQGDARARNNLAMHATGVRP